jgi:ubiquinone/menaquinone biosynthesis C-methylase UbiE
MTESDVILKHYRDEAAALGLRSTSTMHDETTRAKEVDAIVACVRYAAGQAAPTPRLLDVGCGNGHLLEQIRGDIPQIALVGSDYSPEMVTLANSRQIARCSIEQGDVRRLKFEDESFDIAVSERCVINVLDSTEQIGALIEIARILKPGGYFICVEAFVDGLANLNRARTEIGLDENKVPYHNRWFEKEAFLAALDGHFSLLSNDEMVERRLPPSNFLSSHYFISRVLYPAVTRREVAYNTEFVRFFSTMEPRGDYAPIQLFLCRKRI